MASDCNTWLICESSSRELKAAQQSCSRSQSITVRWIVQVVIVTLKHTHTHARTHTHTLIGHGLCQFKHQNFTPAVLA